MDAWFFGAAFGCVVDGEGEIWRRLVSAGVGLTVACGPAMAFWDAGVMATAAITIPPTATAAARKLSFVLEPVKTRAAPAPEVLVPAVGAPTVARVMVLLSPMAAAPRNTGSRTMPKWRPMVSISSTMMEHLMQVVRCS